MSKPEEHLRNLLGMQFEVVGPDMDTSPRHNLSVRLVTPHAGSDLLGGLASMMSFAARQTNHRFIAFVDSRKQAEYIASIAARQMGRTEDESVDVGDHIEELGILPYRAGYEERDREAIQKRLSRGSLTGVVSTSALELGIDIPHITLGILVGVPYSATSLQQRIGRVGRHCDGEVVVVNTGSLHSRRIFRHPDQLMKLPLTEGALYLGNQRIQYIHTLCLARHGGENDQTTSSTGVPETSRFESPLEWPDGFMRLCESERIGVVSPELQNMKAQAGDDPNHAFPLRDVDVQFRVQHSSGPLRHDLGTLSYDQLLREAYPGAVYYYATRPYRVYRVRMHNRTVEVRREKSYHTRPLMLPTLVFPNISLGNVHMCRQHGPLVVLECDLQVRESCVGFKERRGPNEFSVTYPLDPSLGMYFDQSRFTRNFFTTGVMLSHPVLNNPDVKLHDVVSLLFEAFLMTVPFERQDISFAADKYRTDLRFVRENDRFLAIYDRTYGSLRLSGRLAESETLRQVLARTAELAQYQEGSEITSVTIAALNALQAAVALDSAEIPLVADLPAPAPVEPKARVIVPGSKGLDILLNEEFWVRDVIYTPKGLYYRGRHLSEQSPACNRTKYFVPHEYLVPIPGESVLGSYDYETGEVTPDNESPRQSGQ